MKAVGWVVGGNGIVRNDNSLVALWRGILG